MCSSTAIALWMSTTQPRSTSYASRLLAGNVARGWRPRRGQAVALGGGLRLEQRRVPERREVEQLRRELGALRGLGRRGRPHRTIIASGFIEWGFTGEERREEEKRRR